MSIEHHYTLNNLCTQAGLHLKHSSLVLICGIAKINLQEEIKGISLGVMHFSASEEMRANDFGANDVFTII